ncbi:MAG: glycosyltransferase family 4 protein [Hyphomonadaceae bacterium]
MQKGHIYSVLQVTPELNAGGVERTTIEMAEAISRAGGLALIASAGGRLEPDLEAAGGELLRLPVNSKNPWIIRQNADRLAEAAKARGINLIHARSRAPAWSALIAARRLGLPFVTTYHGVYNARSPLKRYYNSVMARGDIVIANSHYTRRHVLDQYQLDPARVVAIPRGVDLEQFDPAAIAQHDIAAMRDLWGLSPGDARLVLMLPARLTRWKGQIVLIDALAELQSRRPGAVKAILAGDAQGRTAYVDELNTRIAASRLREAVAIVGHLSQMPTALAASDAALFPSVEPEAFGRGAVEAQAMGLPVIAANHGGLAETVVDGETGILVTPGDSGALAAAIERLLDMGVEARAAMGLRGKSRARRDYAKTALQSSTLQVYDRLLGVKA